MASWEEIAAEQPEFAALIHARFGIRKHCTLATLRKDGSPRISGSEVEFADGQVWLGSMPGAMKALDLRRDPRFALHSPTEDPPEDNPSDWPGEAKLAGRAEEVSDPDTTEAHRFRLDITEMVLTCVEDDTLVVQSWHPGRGVETIRRDG
jgi:hypothetical protein